MLLFLFSKLVSIGQEYYVMCGSVPVPEVQYIITILNTERAKRARKKISAILITR